MPHLTIVADIHAVPGQVERVHASLQSLVAPTRAEDGCLRYDLHRDNDDPAHFLFYETWASREQWLAHMESPHLKAHQTATEGAAEVTIWEMTAEG